MQKIADIRLISWLDLAYLKLNLREYSKARPAKALFETKCYLRSYRVGNSSEITGTSIVYTTSRITNRAFSSFVGAPIQESGRSCEPCAASKGKTSRIISHLRILVLTAMGKEEMDHAIKAGANRAMNKPVLLDALADDVREMLAESEPRQK